MTYKTDLQQLVGALLEATRTGDLAKAHEEGRRLLERIDDYVDEKVELALGHTPSAGYAAPLYSRH